VLAFGRILVGGGNMRAGMQWIAACLEAGLETRVVTERDVLDHVTPAVLVKSLPRDVLTAVFDTALGSGAMSPETVVRAVTPELLVEHAPGNVIWKCLAAGAERAGLAPNATPRAEAIELVRRSLAAATSLGVVAPADLVRHVTPKVVTHQFPDALTTRLLEASLAAGKMSAELVVETLGLEAIATHAPAHAWACLAAAADAIAAGTRDTSTVAGVAQSVAASAPKKPALEVMDEVASVLVDLDDSAVLKPMLIETPPAGDGKKPHKQPNR
jgi:hypothetical protein